MWTIVTGSTDVFGQKAKQTMMLEALLAILRELNIYIYKRCAEDQLGGSVSKVTDLGQILGTHMVEEEN